LVVRGFEHQTRRHQSRLPSSAFPATAAAGITAVQLFFNLPRVFDVGGGDRIGTETSVGERCARRSPPAASGALDFSVCFCLQALRLLPWPAYMRRERAQYA